MEAQLATVSAVPQLQGPTIGKAAVLEGSAGRLPTEEPRHSPVGKTKNHPQNRSKIYPPEGFMGSKSAQNLPQMPNLLLDYADYKLNQPKKPGVWG